MTAKVINLHERRGDLQVTHCLNLMNRYVKSLQDAIHEGFYDGLRQGSFGGVSPCTYTGNVRRAYDMGFDIGFLVGGTTPPAH